jgi:hypothetical protein
MVFLSKLIAMKKDKIFKYINNLCLEINLKKKNSLKRISSFVYKRTTSDLRKSTTQLNKFKSYLKI